MVKLAPLLVALGKYARKSLGDANTLSRIRFFEQVYHAGNRTLVSSLRIERQPTKPSYPQIK